jgi:hypothetical protein
MKRRTQTDHNDAGRLIEAVNGVASALMWIVGVLLILSIGTCENT